MKNAGLFLFLLMVGTWLAAAAQTIPIAGTVNDPAGALVPDAKANLLSADGSLLGETVTNQTGTFRLSAPAPGRYTVEVHRDGFKTFSVQVSVGASSPKPLLVVLHIAELAQRTDITVAAEDGAVSIDPAENRDAVVVSGNSLEKLPVFDQDYVGALSNFLDQGSVGTMGTTIVVDGMEQKNAGVTPSAVQSVKINNDPYSAEYSRPGRGRIEITTKTPDPVYHGELNVIFRDYHLDARNAFANVQPPEQRRIFEGEMTGPLAKIKRTYFLLSADYQQDNIQSIVFAQLPSGLLQENVPSPARNKDLAARIRHDFSDRHTASLQFTYEGQAVRNQLSQSNQGFSAAQAGGGRGSPQTQVSGGYVLPEAGQNISGEERHLTFSDKLVLTPNLLNQLQVMYEHNRDSTASMTEQAQINVQNAFVGGGAQATQLDTENNIDIRDVLSWSHNAHTVTTGFAMPNMSRRALDDYANRLGTFNFASLQDYVDARPYSFTQQAGPIRFLYWQKEVGAFVQDQIRVRSNLQVTVGVRWDWQNELHDNANFAPRASAGYAFGKNRTMVLRVGGGIFYDRTGSRPIANLALYGAPSLTSVLLLNPTYPDPFAAGTPMAGASPNVYRFQPNIRTPYTAQYSASLERHLFKSATISATYRGSVGVGLFRDLDVNEPLPPFYSQRPYANYGVYQQIESSGRQVGQALDVSFTGKINKYFSGLAQYTLSKTNNNTGGINYMPPNSYDLRGEYSRADFDQRNRFNTLLNAELNKWTDLGVGFSAASGLPYTWTLGQDLFNTGFANARPTGVPRNSLLGPGYVELDMRWSHDFMLTRKGDKGPVVTFAADAFNLPNHVNYSQFVGNQSSPFFGRAVSALPARRLQFTLRFKF